MINEQVQSHVKQLVQSPQWKAIEQIAQELITKVQDGSPIRETNDETLKELFLKEGKVRGIRELFQELIKIASQSNVER